MRVTRRDGLRRAGLGVLALVAAACGRSGRLVSGPESSAAAAPVRVAYGSDPSQFAELSLPGGSSSVPVVVVIHGGYWGSAYGLELGRPLALDLVKSDVAVWNIEYRRIGNGGGYPMTLEDVGAAVDALAGAGQQAAGGRLDLKRVAVVGHSAGGQLAVWVAGRRGAAVPVVGVVSQAGVLDLVAASRLGLGSRAADRLLGGSPAQVPDRYASASPLARIPIGVPVTLVHGLDDDTVPVEQSDVYAAAARAAGDVVVEHRLPGVEHFSLIDPASDAWALCRTAVLGYLGR